MERKVLVKKLIKEGFSEKTLLNMPDSQIKLLSLRFLKEQEDDNTTYVSKDEKNDIQNLKNDKKKFVTYEEEMDEEEKSEEEKDVKEWVDQLVQPEKGPFTTKDEIMEMIKFKLQEQFGSPEPDIVEPDVKPGTEEPETPTTPSKRPYHDPWKEPGKGPDPKPKMETGELPDWLTFDGIMSSMNEEKIERIAKNILSELKKMK